MITKLGALLFAIAALTAHAEGPTTRNALIEWEKIPGAKSYEILIEKNGSTVAKRESLATSKEIPLLPGLYTFKIRAVDKNDRPGEYSAPSPIFIAPEAAKILAPADGSELKTYSKIEKLEVKTNVSDLANCRNVELYSLDNSKTVETQNQCDGGEAPVHFDNLAPGHFELRVRIGTRNPIDTKKIILTEATTKSKFSVTKQDLAQPKRIRPAGSFVRAPTPFLWKWKPVPDAEEYYLKVSKVDDTSARDVPLEYWIPAARASTFAVKWPDFWADGSYHYEMRAAREKRTVLSEVAEEDFYIDRFGAFAAGHAETWLGMGTYARYYRIRSVLPEGHIRQNSTGVNLVSESRLWLSRGFGVAFNARIDSVDLNEHRYLLSSIAPGVTQRLRLSNAPLSPTLAFTELLMIEENLIANPTFGNSFAQPIVYNSIKTQIIKTRVGAEFTLPATEHLRFAWRSEWATDLGRAGRSLIEIKPLSSWDTRQTLRVLLSPWKAFTIAPEVGAAYSEVYSREEQAHGAYDATRFWELNFGIKLGVQL